MRLTPIISSLAVLALLTGAAAAMETARDRQERACQADAMKLCRDDVPDEAKIAACMGRHRSELSINCGIVFDAGMRTR